MRRQRSFWTFLLVLLAAACGHDPTSAPPRGPGTPSFAISDGANGGNKNFFFLPPLVPNPSGSPNYRAGQFNARLTPTVEICRLTNGAIVDVNPADGRCDTGVVARWGASAVTLSVADQQYQVNWKTDSVALDLNALYRIRVLVGDRELGFVDIDPVTRDQLKDYQTGASIPLAPGRTLPIKFRIQNGALVGNGASDYAERTVPATGGTDNVVITKNRVSTTVAGTFVKTVNGQAAAFFPNGWLPPGVASVVVTIERVPVPPGASCHNVVGLVEFEGCYRYTTFPRLPFRTDQGAPPFSQFYRPVTVQMCTTLPVTDARYDGLSLFKSGVGEPLTVLPEVDPVFDLSCDAFRPTPPGNPTVGVRGERGGALTKLAAAWRAATGAALDGLAAALTPRLAYAVDLGAGGEALSFSNIGFGIRQSLQSAGPVDLTPAPGAAAPPLAQVRVVAQHDHAANGVLTPPEYFGVAGVPVTFSVTAGGGTVPNAALPGGAGAVTTVVSDAGGYARVPWTLGAAGANGLTATIAGGIALPYAGSTTVAFTAATADVGITIGGLVRDNTSPQASAIPAAVTATLTAADGSGATRTIRYVGGTTGALDDVLRASVPADAAFFGKQAVLSVTFVPQFTSVPQTRTALVVLPAEAGRVVRDFAVTALAMRITGTVYGPNNTTPIPNALVRVGLGDGTTSAASAVSAAGGAYALNLQQGDPTVAQGSFSFYAVDAPGFVPLRNVYAGPLPASNQVANLSLLPANAQGVMVQAAVYNNSTSPAVPVPGITVVVDNTELSVVTGPGGRFAIYVPWTAIAPGATLSYGPATQLGARASLPMPGSPTYVINGFSGPFVAP